MRERLVENKLKREARKRGGAALKTVSPGTDGFPDRLVCLPVGWLRLVETKAPGGRLSPKQEVVHRFLASLGIPVFVIDSLEGVDNFFKQEYDI